MEKNQTNYLQMNDSLFSNQSHIFGFNDEIYFLGTIKQDMTTFFCICTDFISKSSLMENVSKLFKLKDNIYIIDFELGVDDGFLYLAGVLSDAGAIYLYSDSSNVFRGLIAKTVVNDKALLHKCVAVNPQYRILVFGCRNGITVAYYQPDDYTSLKTSNFYETESRLHDNSNAVCLKWTPDFKCLTVLYDNGTFCLFSVFGTPLYESKELFYYGCSSESLKFVKNLDFGYDGYSIWLYAQPGENSLGQMMQLKTLKCSNLNNFSMSNVEHIALNGEREVYVCLNLNKINSKCLEKFDTDNKKLPQKYQYPCLKLGGNSIWQIINVPLTYISTNYPIKMTSIDVEGKYLAVAGSRGFTHYSFLTRKWKIFGNADQEKDIKVTGGILWWKEFICMSCVNLGEGKNEAWAKVINQMT
ncbi:RAB6A-GEF complex partner 1-like [Brachionus plicatilis]|uniref:RAB6A-GEF complex partner 1-like n=1 Tax=Brachionus plicatilis TaxID=10195 RepID=A0A3M7QYR2_BRAPC|nr:RAB6A-GEF complex partner 1-like [Brachionus plicatilis]